MDTEELFDAGESPYDPDDQFPPTPPVPERTVMAKNSRAPDGADPVSASS